MHVLVCTGLTLPEVSDADLDRIAAAAGPDATVTLARTPEQALAAAPEVEVILGYIDAEVFAAAPRLRWVAAIASGVDHYLFPALKDSDVVLTSEKGLVGSHLADHAFGLLLSLTRGIAQTVRYGNEVWEHRMQFRRENIELEGLTMGIVGLGGTGRAIARRAAGFGMLCQAIDREEVTTTPEVSVVQPVSAFNALIESSDVVAVCCPLTAETQDLFDDDAFARMKPTAFLINVTRGGIVDGDALIRALEGGQIAGAGLDVTPEEPLPPDHPLWDAPNLVITPHTAGASPLRAGRNLDRFCRNLEHLRAGEQLEGVVDKELGF